MATLELQIADSTVPYWTQTVTLEGVAYLLTFRFNGREDCFYLQIQSADGSITYAQGIKLVSNFLLLATYLTPPGELMAVASGADDSPAGLGELGPNGQRVTLLYIESADLFAANVEENKNPSSHLP